MPVSGSNTPLDVLVVGAGPAGLAAACAALEKGVKTALLERLDRPGSKLLASGGGRCNLGNTLEPAAFMARFGREGRFMAKALEAVPPEWVRGFLASKGVECVASDGFHYFPKSGRAVDILDAFLDICGKSLMTETRAESIEHNGLFKVRAAGRELSSKSVILTTGGCAWPSLGGTRFGLELAKSLGHSIVKPLPAMAPLIVEEKWVGALAGVSLPLVRLVLDLGGRKRFESEGELVFTHDGLSGPAALDISGEIAYACDKAQGPVGFSFHLKPGWEAKEWREEIDSWRKTDPRRFVRSALAKHCTHSLADSLCALAECPDSPCCELKAADRDKLAALLASTPMTASGAGPMARAMAMRGGVSLKEVESKTLESRIVPGLFFAGELLDIVGPCGGYNIQWALSSGRLAGLSAAKQ